MVVHLLTMSGLFSGDRDKSIAVENDSLGQNHVEIYSIEISQIKVGGKGNFLFVVPDSLTYRLGFTPTLYAVF